MPTTAIAAGEYGGELYYRVSSDGGDLFGFDELTRLTGDARIVLLRHLSDCQSIAGYFSPRVVNTSFVYPYDPSDPSPPMEAPMSVGMMSLTPGVDVTWSSPGTDIGSGSDVFFELTSQWGMIRDNSAVQVALTPGSSDLTTVFSAPLFQLHPAHRDDLLAWSDWTGWSPPASRAGLRIWTPQAGSTLLFKGPGDVMNVAITDDRIIWAEASGLDSVEGATKSITLCWSPRTTDPASVIRTVGPVIPYTETTIKGLVAYGDLATALVFSNSGKGVVVANLVTKKTTFIPNRPGETFDDVLAMNAKYLLLSEYGQKDISIQRIVRLDLSKVDELAQGWPMP